MTVLIQKMNGARIIIKWQIKHQSAGGRHVKDLLFSRMDMQFQPIGFMHKLVPKYMVKMTMGIDQHNGFQLFRFNEGTELIPLLVCIASRINDNAIPTFIVHQISILLKRIELENFNVYHSRFFLGKCVNFSLSTWY